MIPGPIYRDFVLLNETSSGVIESDVTIDITSIKFLAPAIYATGTTDKEVVMVIEGGHRLVVKGSYEHIKMLVKGYDWTAN